MAQSANGPVAPSFAASKTFTFDGTAGKGANGSNAVFFTVTGGAVVIDEISGRVVTNLTVSNVLATLQLGVVGQLLLFIAATLANSLLTTAALWVSATATPGGILLPAITRGQLVNANIVGLVAGTGDITGGVLEVNVRWHPATPGALLVAA